jgi:hypothetical protein
VDRDTANKNSEGTKTRKEKLKRRRRRPPPQLPLEERKRFPKPQKVATRKISKEICSLKGSRDENSAAWQYKSTKSSKITQR